MPGPTPSRCSTRPRRLGVGFCLGYAELDAPTGHRYNTADPRRARRPRSSARYRKVHLPGHEEHEPWRPFQHLERRYFEPGPDGFGVWRGVRRRRRHGDLQRPALARDLPGAGPAGRRADPAAATTRRSTTRPTRARTSCRASTTHLVMQAGAYQNGTWVVGVAKGGVEEGVDSLGAVADHRPVGPDRRPGARPTGDELVVAALRPRLVRALQADAVRLRPLPAARALRPDHRPQREGPSPMT